MIERHARVLLAGLAATLAAVATLFPQPPPTLPLSVILVSIDTLRADHLGCYGYPRPTSPRIDAFSHEAILYEAAIASSSSTLASHASIFTSLPVPHHGASVARGTALSPSHVTLSEILRAQGYATASWNGGVQLDRAWGLDQGFDVYRSFPQPARSAGMPEHTHAPVDRFDMAVGAALDWLDLRADEDPFFLFLHTYEIHHPYTPEPELRDRFDRYPTALGDSVSLADLVNFNEGHSPLRPGDLEHVVASYDAEIVSVDRAFGRLVDGLRDRGLLERTLVVLTSDHGEEFGEHGSVGWHGHTLFDELLRVPLLVRLPGGGLGGTRIGAQVSGTDLAPTVLDAVGIVPPAVFEGRSVLPVDRPDRSDRRRFALSGLDNRREDILSLRGERWKWIRFGGLYDLLVDPGESDNLRRTSDEAEARRRAMMSRADRWRNARRPPPAPGVELRPELVEQLEALGYIEPRGAE